MLRELTKVANRLDSLGLNEEASVIDSLLVKMSSEESASRSEEALRIASLISDVSEMSPYERWAYMMKTNRDDGVLLMKPDARVDSFLTNDEREKLRKIRVEFREDREKNRAEYEERWTKKERMDELEGRPSEEVEYAAFQTVEPHIKGKIFLKADETGKSEIIERMTPFEAASFLNDSIMPNLKMFEKKLAEGDFGIANSTDNILASKDLVKKFYSLLSDEDKTLLREKSRGGTAMVRGNPFGYSYEAPSEIPEVETVFEAPSAPYDLDAPRQMFENRPPILPELRERKGLTPSGLSPVPGSSSSLSSSGRIETVKDISASNFYIFQKLPRPTGIEFGQKDIWILQTEVGVDQQEFDMDPDFAVKNAEDRANEIADRMEERYSEKNKSEDSSLGECIVLGGKDAREFISSGMARITPKRFGGAANLADPEDLIGRSERGTSRLDAEKQELGSSSDMKKIRF